MNQPAVAEPPSAASRASFLAINVIFFCSGVPALIYQLVWQRSLFSIYGINIESVTVVVTAFMLGLGIGSFLGGRFSRLRMPLLLAFALVELGICAFGFFSLHLFHAVGKATLLLSAPMTALVTFLLVLLPTTLMGATLPLLTAYLVRHKGNVGQSVGTLYFVNTLGSAAACFMVAFFIMRWLGQQGAVSLAAGLNLAVGAGALFAHFRAPALQTGSRAEGQSFNNRGFCFALFVSALCGYIALSYEILWYRVYSFVSGGMAQAFALLLGCYLLGIALGSALARRFCRTPGGKAQMGALFGFVLAANVVGFAVAPLASHIASIAEWAFTFPLIVVAAGLLGATFPLICHFAIPPDARAGEGLSYLYLANIVGSSGGSLVTGFVLMDYWSIGAISVFLSWLGVALALSLLAFAGLARRQLAVRVLAGLMAAAVLFAAREPLFDGIYERLYFKQDYSGQRFAIQVESKSGVVSVTQHGTILGSGVYDGVFSTDLVVDRNIIVRAYALSYFHPAPREVLMIGLASGSWAQVVANNPYVEKLTIIEISPAYLKVVPQFPDEASVLTNPKVEIIIDDGRRWLSRNPDRKFDAIVQNTTFNWRANATNLLSVEWQDLIRSRLKEGGISYFNSTWSDEAQRTAAVSWKHAIRFVNFMAVGDSPFQLDKARWERVLRDYRIDGRPVLDLSKAEHRARLESILALPDTLSDGYGPEKRLGMNMETREGVLKRTEGLPVITDDNMGTEWMWRHN